MSTIRKILRQIIDLISFIQAGINVLTHHLTDAIFCPIDIRPSRARRTMNNRPRVIAARVGRNNLNHDLAGEISLGHVVPVIPPVNLETSDRVRRNEVLMALPSCLGIYDFILHSVRHWKAGANQAKKSSFSSERLQYPRMRTAFFNPFRKQAGYARPELDSVEHLPKLRCLGRGYLGNRNLAETGEQWLPVSLPMVLQICTHIRNLMLGKDECIAQQPHGLQSLICQHAHQLKKASLTLFLHYRGVPDGEEPSCNNSNHRAEGLHPARCTFRLPRKQEQAVDGDNRYRRDNQKLPDISESELPRDLFVQHPTALTPVTAGSLPCFSISVYGRKA